MRSFLLEKFPPYHLKGRPAMYHARPREFLPAARTLQRTVSEILNYSFFVALHQRPLPSLLVSAITGSKDDMGLVTDINQSRFRSAIYSPGQLRSRSWEVLMVANQFQLL